MVSHEFEILCINIFLKDPFFSFYLIRHCSLLWRASPRLSYKSRDSKIYQQVLFWFAGERFSVVELVSKTDVIFTNIADANNLAFAGCIW